jgi:hypothetical protein
MQDLGMKVTMILSCYVWSVMVARMDGNESSPPAVSDEQLIAWHGEELSGYELAEREGLAVKWIYRQWGRLRRHGLIARGGRTGGGRLHPPAPAGTDNDGRPRVGWYEDPLLDRLIEAHGEGGRADLVDVRRRKGVGSGGEGRGGEGGS